MSPWIFIYMVCFLLQSSDESTFPHAVLFPHDIVFYFLHSPYASSVSYSPCNIVYTFVNYRKQNPIRLEFKVEDSHRDSSWLTLSP